MTLKLFTRAQHYADQTAIIAPEGVFTYRQLLASAGQVATTLLAGATSLNEARVAFLVSPGFTHVAVQWGIWLAGGIAVPLAVSHPAPELEYVIADAGATIVIIQPEFEPKFQAVAHSARFLLTPQLFNAPPAELPAILPHQRAMIVYTSGTTGKPKGAVTTHRNIQAQVTTLVSAWGWTKRDRILHTLPLHHVHGIINALTCALWAGATCDILPRFEADAVWQRFIHTDLTLFMAVPTIYARLIAAWDAAPPEQQAQMSAACRKLRLMVSGSAALPVSVLEKWRSISGHTLLERYGMTEIGMALSNPLHGERRPGYVGAPLPGVGIRLVDDQGHPITTENTPGEIQVQGPSVFLEYWQRPQATAAAFQADWFCTGDTAVVDNGVYRILGRNSVDIIKTGGYKVSALEIEETLRLHPAIEDCAVVGVDDPEWGERVCAGLVLNPDCRQLTAAELRGWAGERLAPYKIPRQVAILAALPRNALGKVVKPALKELFLQTD